MLRPSTEVLISWTFLSLNKDVQNHMRASLGRPGDVSEGRPQVVCRVHPTDVHPTELQIRPSVDVLITSAGDVFKTSAGDVPWRYI